MIDHNRHPISRKQRAIATAAMAAALLTTTAFRGTGRFSHGTQGPIAARAAASKTNPPADLRGIYVGGNDITHENPTSLAAALKVAGVDGLLLNIGWDEIEPAMGQYEWSTLDNWTQQAIADGKKMTISVGAGTNTPPWLFQPAPDGAGANPLSFSISRKGGQSGVCDPETIAAPWDTAFLKQWDSMLSALSAHLKSTGAYKSVVLLRLTGINRDTDELHLPTETAQSTGLACVSDAIATWQQAGYRPSLLLQGWDTITSSFQKSFPGKSFSVAIIARTNTPFPPIAEDGSIITNPVDNESQPPLMLASQKFPGHLVIQNNTLYADVPAQPATIQFAQSLGTMIAFQTNEDLVSSTGKHAACSEPSEGATPCTDATYLSLLQTGIYPLGQGNALRAQYIEIFATDAGDFPIDTLQAHTELAPDTLALEVGKQKPNGKLVVYVTTTDPKATLSVSALPLPPSVMPIVLGNMSKADPNGNEFFIVAKNLPPVGSVQITSTSGGTLTVPIKHP